MSSSDSVHEGKATRNFWTLPLTWRENGNTWYGIMEKQQKLQNWNLFKATENALKVQISQLETTLKSDLNDKSRLTEALAREREAFAQMESDFQVSFFKTDLLRFPVHYKSRICKASSWQWRRTLKSRRTNCATLQKWVPLELKRERLKPKKIPLRIIKKNYHSG